MGRVQSTTGGTGQGSRRIGHRLRRSAVVLCAALLLVAAAGGFSWYRHLAADRELLVRLQSDDATARKLAAWLAAERRSTRAMLYIVQQLQLDAEADPDVREAFVHSVGTYGEPAYFPVIAPLVDADPSGYVRQAAWLALARLDPARFLTLEDSYPPAGQDWDRLGRARALIYAFDTSGVPTLFEFARAPDANQHRIAMHALYKGVRPLLETAGRWPLGTRVDEGAPWPVALVTEVAERAAEVDLQRIAASNAAQVESVRLMHRNVHRLTSAREWIAWFLMQF